MISRIRYFRLLWSCQSDTGQGISLQLQFAVQSSQPTHSELFSNYLSYGARVISFTDYFCQLIMNYVVLCSSFRARKLPYATKNQRKAREAPPPWPRCSQWATSLSEWEEKTQRLRPFTSVWESWCFLISQQIATFIFRTGAGEVCWLWIPLVEWELDHHRVWVWYQETRRYWGNYWTRTTGEWTINKINDK